MYCINCNENADVSVHSVNKREYHMTLVKPHSIEFYDLCYGPFTQCPPPITEEDWDFIFAHEPSPDEMELMEQEADVLLQSLMGN